MPGSSISNWMIGGRSSGSRDPHSPWKKGAVENANGLLRRYLPSDVPEDRLSAEHLQTLALRMNATPRRCLGYRTPAEVFAGRPPGLSHLSGSEACEEFG